MHKIRSLAACAAVAAALIAAAGTGRARAAGDKNAAAEKERQLIAVLQSDAPAADKAIPCKQLAIYGSKAAVPALAPLLADRELASWARIALEAIPDPAADEALRGALPKLQGRLLIGAINSLGVRRDAKAADALVQRLKDPDPEVASAAAEALGRIGGEKAAQALEQSLAGAPAAVRSSVAYGCVLCAERDLADGKADRAVRLYDTVRKADVPKQRVLEATRGAILARGAGGAGLLVELLRSADKALFGVGLRVARELPGPEATDALVAEMAKAAPDRQSFLLLALADRGDPKALPAVLAAAKGAQSQLRVVAIGVLERLGDASCVPLLLDAAMEADPNVAASAKNALIRLPGEGVNADLQARLPKAPAKTRPLLIELAGRRQIAGAVPAIVRCVEDADPGVRAAAVGVVGSLGGAEHLAGLVKVLQKTQDAAEQAGIEKALMAISVRAGAGCAGDVMPLARSGSAALRAIGLHALACAGGPDALAAVQAALDDKDEAVQDEAVRTLSTWPNRWPQDDAAAGPLLGLAKSGKKVAHKTLGLRGYLQYVQGAKKPDDRKLAMVKDVLPLIARPEEKRLAVSVLGGVRNGEALEMLVGFATDPAVAEEACSALVDLAGKGDLKGATKEQRRSALQMAIQKAKSGRIRTRAQQTLKSIK